MAGVRPKRQIILETGKGQRAGTHLQTLLAPPAFLAKFRGHQAARYIVRLTLAWLQKMPLTCGCQRWQLPTLALRNSEAAVCSAPISVNYQPLHVGLCKDMVGELCTSKQRHVQIWRPPPPSESLKNQEVCPRIPVDLRSLSFPFRPRWIFSSMLPDNQRITTTNTS